MLFPNKKTGVLLHPTSLPGRWGIGTLGSESREFVNWIHNSGASVWQLLPLTPPVFGNSPYQSLSSFAGNPLLISPEELFNLGLISSSELQSTALPPSRRVSWDKLGHRKKLLNLAAARALSLDLPGFDTFSKLPWVREWSLFIAAKSLNNGVPWHLWTNNKQPEQKSVLAHSMIQFLFHRQWTALKEYAHSMDVEILGDMPIYAAHDSSDVFFNRNVFKLGEDGLPRFVAGVPPDYFSKTGQLWGNPVYDWEACAATGYRWWLQRMAHALDLYDLVRIDHFRGFAEYWEIPYGEKTAVRGRWVKGPGIALFNRMKHKLGALPVVAEDLGLITESVTGLRKECGFPGMIVLQFALLDPDFTIAYVKPDTVIYTGTHDNDTTAGWIKSKGSSLGITSVDEVIDAALSSAAVLAVLPMQDVLKLGSSARMNRPGTTAGNWSWRLSRLPYPVSLVR